MATESKSIAVYSFSQGETISIALDNVEGDISQVTSVSSAIKFVESGRTFPLDNAEVIANFAVIPRDADGEIPEGWTLIIESERSALLEDGRYMADAKLVIGSSTQITEPVYIDISGSITP